MINEYFNKNTRIFTADFKRSLLMHITRFKYNYRESRSELQLRKNDKFQVA